MGGKFRESVNQRMEVQYMTLSQYYRIAIVLVSSAGRSTAPYFSYTRSQQADSCYKPNLRKQGEVNLTTKNHQNVAPPHTPNGFSLPSPNRQLITFPPLPQTNLSLRTSLPFFLSPNLYMEITNYAWSSSGPEPQARMRYLHLFSQQSTVAEDEIIGFNPSEAIKKASYHLVLH